VIVTSLPTLGALLISPQLAGSRLLYLPCVGWGIFVGAVLDTPASAAPRSIQWVVLSVMLIATIVQQQERVSMWLSAAVARDRILTDAVREAEQSGCGQFSEVQGLPSDLGGAQLFRNGFDLAYATVRSPATGSRSCILIWDGERFRTK
jgi:hypothetical protein